MKLSKYPITVLTMSAKPSSRNLYPLWYIPRGNNIKVKKKDDTGKISLLRILC